MTSYIFPEKQKQTQRKSIIATDNINKYREERKSILNNYVRKILDHLEKIIFDVSRNYGKNAVNFNYSKIEFTQDKNGVRFEELTDEEHNYIQSQIIEYLKKEGYNYELPGSEYNSRFYRTHLKIWWDYPEYLRSEILADYPVEKNEQK